MLNATFADKLIFLNHRIREYSCETEVTTDDSS